MTREIEKIMALREKLDGAEKVQMGDAVCVLNKAFMDMVVSTKDCLLNGEAGKIQHAKVKDALNTIKVLADKRGVEFPAFESREEVTTFVLKYGTEIVRTR